jgi:hypothetical protein
MRDAETLRARHEAEAAARLDALRATHAHEERLAVLRSTAGARGGGRAVHVTFLLLALTWAAGTWCAARGAERMAEDRAWARAASADARSAVDGLQVALHQQADAIAAVRARIDALPHSDAPAPTAPAARDADVRGAPPARGGGALRPTHTSVGGARCREGDPMCSELP